MQLFKVTIEHRKPVATTRVSYEYLEKNQNELLDAAGSVTSLFIVAENEKDSVHIAEKLIADLQNTLGIIASEAEKQASQEPGIERG